MMRWMDEMMKKNIGIIITSMDGSPHSPANIIADLMEDLFARRS